MHHNTFTKKLIPSPEEKLQLLIWFLVIVIATTVFKFGHLDTIYRGGFPLAIENYLVDDTWLEYLKVVCLFFIRNIAEVVILLSLLYIVFCKMLGLKLETVIVASTLSLFLIAGANQLSLLNVKTLLTFDSLMVTTNWMKENPDVISSYINKRNFLYTILIVFLSFLPILTSKTRIREIIPQTLNHVFLSVLAFIFVISILLYFSIGVFLKADANQKPFDGYWSSVTTSFISNSYPNPLKRKIPDLVIIKSQYYGLVYPEHKIDLSDGNVHKKTYTLPENTDKKHIIIISLETAPQKYYPLVNNTEFKSFYQMSKHSIVSNKHFTNSPYTTTSTDSMLTGMYMPGMGIPIMYGNMAFNGLANVLSKNGYSPTYIDSYHVDWHEGDKRHRAVKSYGFMQIFDRGDYDYKNNTSGLPNSYEKALYAETVSFNKIVESVDDAIKNNKKSLVFVDTIFGHFKWRASEENRDLSNADKILKIAGVFNELLANLLKSLKNRGIENDVIIVVTGDHGLRYHEEYTSLSEPESNLAVTFNVPFLIYSPGLFKKQIVLDHTTSHIDLAPTLLELVGIDISQYFFHGQNVLNPMLENRTIFLMNQMLKPESSFLMQGVFYTYNNFSSELYTTTYQQVSDMHNAEYSKQLKAEKTDTQLQPVETLKKAEELFNDSAAYFLQRHKASPEEVLDVQFKKE